MQNKPNFPHFSPKNDDFTKNKPNSNPIKAKTNPIQTQSDEREKLKQSVYTQRIMKKNTNMGPKKQTQKKQTQFKPNFKRQISVFSSQMKPKFFLKFIDSCDTKTPSKTDGNDVDICTLLCHYKQHLICFFNLRGGSQAEFRFSIMNNTETSSN